MPSDDNNKSLEQFQVERLIDDKIKVAIKEYDVDLQSSLATMFIIKLSKFETMFNVMKFVVVAVALLVIGTLYQIFVNLARSGGGQ